MKTLYRSLVIYGLLTLVALAAAIERGHGWPIVAVSGGVALWTLIEYLAHRFVFHPAQPWASRLVDALHMAHHRLPRSTEILFVRLRFSLPVSGLITGVLLAALRDASLTAAVMGGVWLGFLYYEWVHYRVHFSPSAGVVLAGQRKRHFEHHFVAPRRNFGVTSPVWDLVFGTYFRGRTIAEKTS